MKVPIILLPILLGQFLLTVLWGLTGRWGLGYMLGVVWTIVFLVGSYVIFMRRERRFFAPLR